MDETTLFFARIASAYLVVTGLGFLCSTAFYERMVDGTATTDPVTVNLSGAVHFLIGISMLIRHFRFGSVPELVVTLIGAAALAKGTMLIAAPQLTLRAPRSGRRALRLSGAAFALVGAYLGYVSYP